MEYSYCRRCGSPLTVVSGNMLVCKARHTIFTTPTPTVGIFIFSQDGNLLLSRRGIGPHKGMLDSFGGFVDGEETLEDAATRELKEELGLSPTDYEPLRYITSANGHYPYHDESILVLSAFYWTRLRGSAQPIAADDVAEIVSLPLHKVDLNQLHDDDVRTGIRALLSLLQRESELI